MDSYEQMETPRRFGKWLSATCLLLTIACSADAADLALIPPPMPVPSPQSAPEVNDTWNGVMDCEVMMLEDDTWVLEVYVDSAFCERWGHDRWQSFDTPSWGIGHGGAGFDRHAEIEQTGTMIPLGGMVSPPPGGTPTQFGAGGTPLPGALWLFGSGAALLGLLMSRNTV
jgi:hypothetical protein